MNLRKLILTGLGTGYLPIAPGTWGSAAVGVLYVLLLLLRLRGVSLGIILALVAAVSTFACIALGRYGEEAFAGKDPSACTIDEWAGQAVALLALPVGSGWSGGLWTVLTAFVLFRIFDILKPPPARRLETLPFGLGVISDDLLAGVYANIVGQVFLRVLLPLF